MKRRWCPMLLWDPAPSPPWPMLCPLVASRPCPAGFTDPVLHPGTDPQSNPPTASGLPSGPGLPGSLAAPTCPLLCGGLKVGSSEREPGFRLGAYSEHQGGAGHWDPALALSGPFLAREVQSRGMGPEAQSAGCLAWGQRSRVLVGSERAEHGGWGRNGKPDPAGKSPLRNSIFLQSLVAQE